MIVGVFRLKPDRGEVFVDRCLHALLMNEGNGEFTMRGGVGWAKPNGFRKFRGRLWPAPGLRERRSEVSVGRWESRVGLDFTLEQGYRVVQLPQVNECSAQVLSGVRIIRSQPDRLLK